MFKIYRKNIIFIRLALPDVLQKVFKKYVQSHYNRFYEKRHAQTTLLPHITPSPQQSNKTLQLNAEKNPLNTTIFKDFKTTPRITTCYYTKTYCIFCKNKQKRPKNPQEFPYININDNHNPKARNECYM